MSVMPSGSQTFSLQVALQVHTCRLFDELARPVEVGFVDPRHSGVAHGRCEQRVGDVGLAPYG